MEETSASVPAFKHFFRHLCRAQAELSGKQIIKQQIETKVRAVKSKVQQKKIDKDALMQQMEILETELKDMVDNERKIYANQAKEAELVNKLQEKVAQFDFSEAKIKPFEDFEKISAKLDENSRRIEKINQDVSQLSQKVVPQERVKILESKVFVTSAPSGSVIQEAERDLQSLEGRYAKLKKSGKYSKKDLARVEQLIANHKIKLVQLKSNK